MIMYQYGYKEEEEEVLIIIIHKIYYNTNEKIRIVTIVKNMKYLSNKIQKYKYNIKR